MRQKSKTLFMETTEIASGQTVGQIQTVLGRYGVTNIITGYDAGEVSEISFCVRRGNAQIGFKLPCRWQKVHTILMNKLKKPVASRKAEYVLQAKRVAWRQILRWVESQLALVETEMAQIEEVFMPYMVVDKKGQTLFEQVQNNGFAGQLLDGPTR